MSTNSDKKRKRVERKKYAWEYLTINEFFQESARFKEEFYLKMFFAGERRYIKNNDHQVPVYIVICPIGQLENDDYFVIKTPLHQLSKVREVITVLNDNRGKIVDQEIQRMNALGNYDLIVPGSSFF